MSPWFRIKYRPWIWAVLILAALGITIYHQPLSYAYVIAGADSLALSAAYSGLTALAAESGKYPPWAPGPTQGI